MNVLRMAISSIAEMETHYLIYLMIEIRLSYLYDECTFLVFFILTFLQIPMLWQHGIYMEFYTNVDVDRNYG